jgi:hypothetical protein
LSKNVPTAFSSESNIHGAVLGEEFKAKLKELHEALRQCNRTSESGSSTDSSPLQRFDDAQTSKVQSYNHNKSKNFLVIDASEELNKENCVTEIIKINEKNPVNEVVLSCPSIADRILHGDEIASTGVVCDKVESKIDVHVENYASSCSQVPEEHCMFSSVLASSCQNNKYNILINEANNMFRADSDCAAQLGAIPHEETSKSMPENVPQNHVMESSLNNISQLKNEVSPHLSVPHKNEFSCESHSSSSSSLFASYDAFEDSFDTSTCERTEDDYIKGAYKHKESNPSSLFSSTPHHAYSKVRVTDSLHAAVCDVSDTNDTFPDLSNMVSAFSPGKTLNSETSFHSLDSLYINNDHVSLSDAVLDSFYFSPVNSVSDGQKNIIVTERTLQTLNHPCRPEVIFSSHNTVDIPLAPSKNTVPAFSLKDNQQGSMVQTALSDFIPSVVLGPCENYTMDYFKGLKTTSGVEPVENISTNPEDISLHLGNNSFTDEKLEKDFSGCRQNSLLMEYCIDSWDKHLSAAFQEHEAKDDLFDDISFKFEMNSLIDENQPVNHRLANTSNSSLEQAMLCNETKEMNSAVENGMRNVFDLLEDSETSENCDQVRESSKYDKLVSKTVDTKNEDSVHDLNVALSILQDANKSITDEEIFNSCHQRSSVNFEHDVGNILVNVLNFVEDSQVSESHNQASTHLSSEKVNTNTTVLKTKARINSESDMTHGLVDVTNTYTIVHANVSTEHGQECKMEGTVEGNMSVLAPDSLQLIQERLKSSGLCIPSLNFIAATPVPSGRNTPDMLIEDTNEALNDETETAANCVLSNEQVVASLIETEEENLVFGSKERIVVEENEQEIEIHIVSQPVPDINVNVTPDGKLSLENLSGEVTLVSELEFGSYNSASETDHSMLIGTRPFESKTNAENSGIELACSNMLLYAPVSAESKDGTSELCEIECEEHRTSGGVIHSGSPDPINTAECGLEVTSSTGLKNMEAVVSTFISTPSSSHTQILKCETGSCTPPDPKNIVITKIELHEERSQPAIATENASHGGQQTKVPFQIATSNEVCALHKQDILVPSDLLTLEGEKCAVDSSLNDVIYEEANIIPTELKHNKTPSTDAHLFKRATEDSSKYCEQRSEDLEHFSDIVKDVHKLHFEENSMLEVSYSEPVAAEACRFAGHISVPSNKKHSKNVDTDLTDSVGVIETTNIKSPGFAEDLLCVEEKNNEGCSSETSTYEQVSAQPVEIKHPDFGTDVLELRAKEIKENCDSNDIDCEQVYMQPIAIKNAQSPDVTINVDKINENSKFFNYEQACLELTVEMQFKILNPVQDIAENKDMCNLNLKNYEQASVEVVDFIHTPLSDIFSDKEEGRVVATVDSWKQKQFDSDSDILMEDFVLEEKLTTGLTASRLNIKTEENFDAAGEMEDDAEDFGLDTVKHSTPDDERSSDSGFRDKGSLSESCEEACDEKYNLEDIEAELEDTFNKGGFNYVDEHEQEEEQNDRAVEDSQGKLSARSSDYSAFSYVEKPDNQNQNDMRVEDIERMVPVTSSADTVYNLGGPDYCGTVCKGNTGDETLASVEGKLTVFMDMWESAGRDGAGIEPCGEGTTSEIKDQLKCESPESDDSDINKSVHEFIRVDCDEDSHDDASTGFQQYELLSVAGGYTEPNLLVKLQEGLESSVMRNETSVNQINQLLESERVFHHSKLLNLDIVSRQQQIVTDSNGTEHVSVEDNQNRDPVTVSASDTDLISLTGSIPDINLATEIHVADKMFADHEIKRDKMLPTILPDDKAGSQMNGFCLTSTQNSGLNVYQILPFDEAHINEDGCMGSGTLESASGELQHSQPIQNCTTGWYLHPPLKNGSCEESEKGLVNLEECPNSIDLGSCSSKCEESNNSENSYVSFSLDEEFVTAIRNELRDKLPCTRQQSEEEEEEEEDSEDDILDPDDHLPQEDRTDIMIHYNTYSAPLSPILEERESVSSVTTTVSDHYSPLSLSNQQDAPKSDSESLSPVFVLDPRDANSRAQYEMNAKKFEQEIREALENCSLSSEDTNSSSDKVHKESSVLFEDLELQSSDNAQGLLLNGTVNEKNIVVVRVTHQHPDDDDLLVVNTDTNEATLLQSPTPKSHLAFVNNRRTLQGSESTDGLTSTPNFIDENEMIIGMNSDTFIIDRSRFDDTFKVDSKFGAGKEVSSDDEVYTPDSISPEHVTGTPSASTLQSPDTENLSGFFLTPSEKSPAPSECPHGPQNSTVFNQNFLHSLSKNLDNQIFEEVQEICLGVANNEAAEIISELENSGIFNNDNNKYNNNSNTNKKGTCTTALPLCEEVSKQELPSCRTSFVNENREVLSLEDISESSELTNRNSDDDTEYPKMLSAVDRLDYLTSPNLDVFCMKVKELTDNSEEEENSLNGNSCNRRLYLNDTLDLLKRRIESRQNDSDPYREDEEKDWSLPNLEASVLSTKAPMPSPEEESWKQIPSMLAFSDLNEVMARCGNEQETFGTISFNGPTQSVSYSSQTEVDDGDLMSTSFSMPGDPGDTDCYAPDWESDSDETNEEDNNSSSSGEFIWKVCI